MGRSEPLPADAETRTMDLRPLTLCLLGLAACATPAPATTASEIDQRMRDGSSELEQLTVEAQVEGAQTACQRAPRVCTLATEVCGVADAAPSRQVFQERCGTAQERCAAFRQACHRTAPRAQLTPPPRSP